MTIFLIIASNSAAFGECEGAPITLWGYAELDGRQLTRNDPYTLIARSQVGIVLAQYALGADSNFEDAYRLFFATRLGPEEDCQNPSSVGDTVYINIVDGAGNEYPVDQNPVVLSKFFSDQFDISASTGDIDGDGFTVTGGDCDDNNADIYPGAAEQCNGVDDNCDDIVDNDIAPVATSCGVGECAASGEQACIDGQMVDSCQPGAPVDEICDSLDNDCDGTVDDGIAVQETTCGVGQCGALGELACVGGQMVNSCQPGLPTDEICDGLDNDCDGDPDEGSVAYYQDDDGDGYGNASVSMTATDLPAGYVLDNTDCNDADSSVHPNAEEICNGLDNNCNGVEDDGIAVTLTTCGIGECASSGELACIGGQMTDSCQPGAPVDEICDSLDNDCDGTVDDGIAVQQTTCGVGECAAAGELACIDGQMTDSCQSGAPTEEICNGLDDNCNGTVDDGLSAEPTTCGIGACASSGELACIGGQMTDSCQPGTPVDEVCNGLDDNCDGTVDDGIAIQQTTCGVGECATAGELACVGGQMIDSCLPRVPVDEVCNGLDDNCNGMVDDGIAVQRTTCGVGECAAAGELACVSGQMTDSCLPGVPVDEVCNGLDDNCDGTVDDGIAIQQTTCGIGECAAAGELACIGGQMFDSCLPGTPVGEVCNGLDDNCDGTVDDGIAVQPTTCGIGECFASGEIACVGGQMVDSCQSGTPVDEVCNGLDDNCNGSVDEGIAVQQTTCGVGECASTGEFACIDGQMIDSCAPGLPVDEICEDGIDQDCDGVDIACLNAAPVAMDDEYNVDEDHTLTVQIPGVLLNDTDADGDLISATLAVAPEFGSVTLNEDGSFTYTPNNNFNGTDDFGYFADDGDLESTMALAVIHVAPVNDAPSADAGPDQGDLAVGDMVVLDGSGSSDIDGDPLSYSWFVTDGPAGSSAALDDPTAVQPRFTVDQYGTYVIELTVNDGLLNSGTDSVVVTTEDNLPPVAVIAPPAQDVVTGDEVCLNGGGSYDDNGDPLTFQWALTTPNGSAAGLNNTNSATPCFMTDVPGQYDLTLTVSDGLLSDEASVTVSVEPANVPPVAVIGEIPAGQMVGVTICLDGSASYDENDDPLTYAWAILNAPEGSIAGLDNPTWMDPCFTPDEAGDYQIQLMVNDGAVDSGPATILTSVSEALVSVPGAASCDDITSAGLTCEEAEECSDTVPEGGVTSQAPEAGEFVTKGSVVTLTISTGSCGQACDVDGDLDGDCDVDMDDRTILFNSFSSCAGADAFVADADYDGDGCITFSDYQIWYGYYTTAN